MITYHMGKYSLWQLGLASPTAKIIQSAFVGIGCPNCSVLKITNVDITTCTCNHSVWEHMIYLKKNPTGTLSNVMVNR